MWENNLVIRFVNVFSQKEIISYIDNIILKYNAI